MVGQTLYMILNIQHVYTSTQLVIHKNIASFPGTQKGERSSSHHTKCLEKRQVRTPQLSQL